MGQEYLVDSNAVIDFFNGKLPTNGKEFMAVIKSSISVITQIELLSNKNIPSQELKQLEAFIGITTIYALDNNVVQQTIALRQTYRLKTPDAIIAATALVYNLTLITRNQADFKNIEGLQVVDPYSL